MPHQQNPKDPKLASRLVLLLVLLAILALWLQHHLGFEFKTLTVITFVGSIVAAVSWMAEFLGKEKQVAGVVKQLLQLPVRLALKLAGRTPVKVIAGFVAFVLAAFSSVTVSSEAPNDQAEIALAPQDDTASSRARTLNRANPEARFAWVLTNPFGRPFQLRVQGYLPATITVFPLSGRQVVLQRDLVASPSVLFRPFVQGMVSLRDKAVFRLSRVDNAGTVILLADTGRGEAFLVGPRRPLAQTLAPLWGLELDAGEVSPGARADLLLHWSNPVSLPLELGPRDCLRAEIISETGIKARAELRLSGAPFTDALMRDGVDAGGVSCGSR